MFQRFLSTFLFLISIWIVLGFFVNDKPAENKAKTAPVDISINDNFVIYQLISFSVQNNTENEIVLGENSSPPENIVFMNENSANKEMVEFDFSRDGGEKVVLAPGEKKSFSFSKFNNEIFSSAGNYKVCVNTEGQDYCAKTIIEDSGMFRSIWRSLFFKPIFNVLIFFTKIFPQHSLALAVLVLTVLIKLILIIPSKNAIVQQQKMQKVQAEIDKVRKKNKGNQQKIAEETMATWKKHGVNPLSSFGPMLIQFPVMIALFYVVKEGLMPHNSVFLWPPLSSFSLSDVSPYIFNFDLRQKGAIWLAIIIAVLQFFSMKLTMSMKKGKDDKKTPEMQIMNKVMTYGLPFMIAFFTYSMPAVVGLYWGISTAFSIGQQWVLNRK